MPFRTAWQAITRHPGRFLASDWPWCSLAYLLCGAAPLLCGAAPFAALAGMLESPLANEMSNPSRFGLAASLLVLAVLYLSPVVARFERWRLRLIDADSHTEPGQRRAARERGYGVLTVIVLGPLDLVITAAALLVPAWLLTGSAFDNQDGWNNADNVKFAVGVLLLPLAVYPITAWAGARAALAQAFLGMRDPDTDRRLVEVTRSRARLVDAFETERRRIERDLHDGTQQRLVALTMALGLARLDLPAGSDAATHIDTAREHAKQALAELRELIRGVHPQILTDRGLAAAITDTASRSPTPVDVDVDLPHRPPAPVEIAAYFAVSEALTNITKHSRAGRAWIHGRRTAGHLVVEIRDDGIGGANPAAGTGLTGIADRVTVVDGRLLLSSPPGGPTVLRMEIPCPPTVHFG